MSRTAAHLPWACLPPRGWVPTSPFPEGRSSREEGLLLIVCRFSWLARATRTLPRVSSLAQHGQDSEQDTGAAGDTAVTFVRSRGREV